MGRVYVAIDLKSFYASVECVDRGLDPLDTNLVVADESRTEKTICLAVTPSLKSYDISGRARLFEVIQRVGQVNEQRRLRAPRRRFSGGSHFAHELDSDPALKLEYIVAPPRMGRYMEVSTRIYSVYLRYVAPEDIFAYSIDEVFIDATGYLTTYHTDSRGFVMMLVRDVLAATGITATAGIGTNLYLSKIAMDIVAKKMPPDKDGVRIAELDEQSYRERLWAHTPITDFWRVGGGTARRLASLGLSTMGDIALASCDRWATRQLYKVFGKNAELLIDHAWGIEPTTLPDVKAYRPSTNSISSGQVLSQAADHPTTRLILWEMADMLSLDLKDKGVACDMLVITISYDRESLKVCDYEGEIVSDHYGRAVPKHAHGTIHLGGHTSSTRRIVDAAMELFDRITDQRLLSRRLCIAACNVIPEDRIPEEENYEQLDLFHMQSPETLSADMRRAEKERSLQEAILGLRHRYGKNAVLKGTNFSEGATARERNRQIGGHKA